MHGAHLPARRKTSVTRDDPFERIVDEVCGGAPGAVWGQHQRRWRSHGVNERRIAKALRQYWGPEADAMRVQLAREDARFVTGVIKMVGDELGLSDADRRRVGAAAVRSRLLGEGDGSLAHVDAAWRAWWPPPPGPTGRERLADFLGAWRAWLEESRT
jgi:hypothetical protein